MMGVSFGAIIFILSACGGSTTSTENSVEEKNIDTTLIDTLAEVAEELIPERITYDVNKITARLDTVYQLPFIVDSLLLDSLFNGDFTESDLSSQEAQFLGFKMPENSPSQWSRYSLTEYIEIDSIKENGNYNEFLESLDLGQTQDANATLLGQITVSENEYYILWTTSYYTLEACPYGHGSYIWATYFNNNEPYDAVLVGEISGGADAPYWSGTTTTAVITKEGAEVFTSTESGGDMDEEGEEIIEKSESTVRYTLTSEAVFEFETIAD